jgi:Holin of 3TMs, for gene-transfer release
MLPSLLAKIGLPVLIQIVSGALGRVDHPSAQSASKALDELESALAGGMISDSQMAEANRHAEVLAQMKQKEFEVTLSEINQSLRAEVASSDAYVRRMRPTFGYLMAFTWAAQMFGIAYVVVFDTEKAASVLDGMASLSTIWAVGLSVLGIYVYKRSEEKQAIVSKPTIIPPTRKPKVNE